MGNLHSSSAVILPYPISANRYWKNWRGRMVVSQEGRDWKHRAAHMARMDGVEQATGPVRVHIEYMPKLTKQGKTSRARMDLDNVGKITLDALNGVAWKDDKQVVDYRVTLGRGVVDGGLIVSWMEVEHEA